MFRYHATSLKLITQIWFQNRRQKPKLLKKTVEQRTREVLEEATKQTEAEQAQRLQGQHPMQKSPMPPQQESGSVPSTPRTLHGASNSTESSPTQAKTRSPY